MKSDTLEFYIYPRESDATKRISLQNIGSYLIDAAGIVAKEQGFGMWKMHDQGLAWVISRMAIEMDEYPREYTTIKIKTWVKDCNPIFSTRNFVIYDETGKKVGQASTLWSIIDFKTRKMVDLLEYSHLSQFAQNENDVDYSMGKPKRVDCTEDYTRIGSHRVAYSDIDTNKHVNSMRYLQWVIDTLDMEEMLARPIKRADINFIKEALYGQEIDIYAKEGIDEDGGKTKRYDLMNGDKTSCCRVKIEF